MVSGIFDPMRKLGPIFIVIVLLIGVFAAFWFYQKQIEARITDLEGLNSEVTAIVKVNDPNEFLRIVNSGNEVDSSFNAMLFSMVSVLQEYQLQEAKEVLFFFKGQKIESVNAQAVFPAEQKSRFQSETNGAKFNGDYFVKLNEERFFLTKRKENLNIESNINLKIQVNPESSFGIQFLPGNTVVDYTIEQNGLNQYVKGESFQQLSRATINQELMRFIPKNHEFGIYQAREMGFQDTVWSSWNEGGFSIIKMEEGFVAFSGYSGSYHWQELIEEWTVDSDSSSSYSMEGAAYRKIELQSGNTYLDAMKWAGPFEDFIIFAENKDALKSFLVLSRAGKMRQENEFKWLPDNFTFAGDGVFTNTYPYFFRNASASNLYAQVGTDFVFSRLKMTANASGEHISAAPLKEFKMAPPKNGWILPSHLHKSGLIFLNTQDSLIAVNVSGDVQWKAPMNEEIIGEVSAIDLFGNQKIQYLFNTKSKLFLIDANGKNVSGFPVKLTQTASCQVKPMDYDNNNNYRFLVGTESGMVFNYSEKGQLVSGWKYVSTGSPIQSIEDHFVLASKDYIPIIDQSGNANLVGRDGAFRNFAQIKLPLSKSKIFNSGTTSANSRFYLSIGNSQINMVSLNGATDSVQLNQEGLQVVGNYSNKDKKYFVATKGSRFILINVLGLIEHEIELIDANVSSFEIVFQNNGDIKNIVVSDDKKLYLYSRNGLLKEGYPVNCNGFFRVLNNNSDDAKLIFYDGEAIRLK